MYRNGDKYTHTEKISVSFCPLGVGDVTGYTLGEGWGVGRNRTEERWHSGYTLLLAPLTYCLHVGQGFGFH